jgi:hypothetical protein
MHEIGRLYTNTISYEGFEHSQILVPEIWTLEPISPRSPGITVSDLIYYSENNIGVQTPNKIKRTNSGLCFNFRYLIALYLNK